MTAPTIRTATPDDCDLILHFVRQLAIYEKAEHEVQSTPEDFHRALFAEGARCEALICELAGEAVGFALFFFNFSTWTGQYGLFLEDLYVSTEHRGCGAGKALLHYLARLAVERGCARFEWNVLDWNQPAIDFYESFGAVAQDEWTGYRLQGEALRLFAGK